MRDSKLPVLLQSLATPKRCLVAAIVFYLLMVVLGSMQSNTDAIAGIASDKLLHFSAYSVLTVLLYAGIDSAPASRAIQTVFIVSLLGAIDEIVQSFFPHREATWTDWYVDVLASVTSVSMLILLLPPVAKWRNKTRHSSQPCYVPRADRNNESR